MHPPNTGKPFISELKNAASANRLPALGLQSVALFLLWSYHFWPAGNRALDQLAQAKESYGFTFAFVASALAGGVLPLALQSLQRGDHRRLAATALPVLLLFWGLRGCMVDLFYQLQSALWGNNALPQTLAIKVLFDHAFFTPLVGVPTIVLFFAWLDSRGSPNGLRGHFRGGLIAWWKREVWPLVPMAWMVWLPALVVIYALPASLQFPTSIIIQCFWAMFLVVLTDKGQAATSAA